MPLAETERRQAEQDAITIRINCGVFGSGRMSLQVRTNMDYLSVDMT